MDANQMQTQSNTTKDDETPGVTGLTPRVFCGVRLVL